MSQKAKVTDPRYKEGQELILKNKWALTQSRDGLKAKVIGQRITKDGFIVYDLLVQRPPIRVSTLETDLEIISE